MSKLYFMAIAVACLFVGTDSFCQGSKKEKKLLREQTVCESIEKQEYSIGVRTAQPLSGRMVHLSHPYSLKVTPDSVYSYLPYYGRAYSIPYGGGEGLIFKAAIQDYQAKKGKKATSQIKFKARTREDLYEFSLEIYPNGNSYIQVHMQNRQSIGFTGEVR